MLAVEMAGYHEHVAADLLAARRGEPVGSAVLDELDELYSPAGRCLRIASFSSGELTVIVQTVRGSAWAGGTAAASSAAKGATSHRKFAGDDMSGSPYGCCGHPSRHRRPDDTVVKLAAGSRYGAPACPQRVHRFLRTSRCL
jgi:hypothetical protein